MRKLLMLAAVGVLFSGVGALLAADDDESDDQGRGHVRQVRPQRDQDLPERRHRRQGRQEDDLLHRPRQVAKKAHQKPGLLPGRAKDDPIKVKVTGTVEEEGRQERADRREDRESREE